MKVEWLLIAAVIIFVIVVFARNGNQSAESKDKPSWAVRAWNSSGAPKVESKRLGSASAELAGRGVGAVARKIKGAARGKADGFKARSAERGEAQREVIAEVRDAAKDAAIRRARQVTDAVSTRWDNHRPAWTRRKRGYGDQEAPGTETPVDDATTEPADTPAVTATARCKTCDTEHTTTVPAGENSREVVCPCGTKLNFFRRIETDPVPEGARPAEVRPILRIVPKEDTEMTATTADAAAPIATEGAASAVPAPADWSQTASRIALFVPESDAELINFMTGEIAGMCGYSSAYESLYETCTRQLGLDPKSVQGLGEFSEQVVELTRQMALHHRRFVATYQAVMEMVADGTQMPYNGRFITGEAV